MRAEFLQIGADAAQVQAAHNGVKVIIYNDVAENVFAKFVETKFLRQPRTQTRVWVRGNFLQLTYSTLFALRLVGPHGIITAINNKG